ncbi:membrane protein [Alkalihalobacillus alcalophilus ATCC 27647 = CGMCC 1.3604]|uniref:Membrane protein n=2 Tax=Alkalihalobacillus alcalophilus TaxID=1445 RepID=A0A094YVF5_ALKAL|nr:hypothetical protein [Alkalihalobacillus alcalophilus]KGA97497.1 membrane protein [Alkalihalobacillus alcalophilus ATCC 27647 = CGMCC 1.3604]MED1563258.1 DUF2269 domain-containing protein [Alkalihalobacillus alcalophilus]THG91761.1 membrane protein [Alkalihalobacillus alcalophilus ATCC 27647 = CGMCC 1.3604]
MIMVPWFRKLTLTIHITSTVGWLGAVFGYIALVIAALTTQDVQMGRVAWSAMEIIGWYVIVPLALVSFLTGLVMSLGTPWGLFRHYWILFKLLLTIVATVVLLLNMPTVSYLANVTHQTGAFNFDGLWGQLLHAGGGLVVLFLTIILSVYKPQGMTRYGKSRQSKLRKNY